MNSLARFLNVDERKGRPSDIALRLRAIIYCVFQPSQFGYLRKRNQTLRNKKTSLDEGMPWVTYNAARFLRSRLAKDAKVFEYGAGGSTIFFADRGCSVESVEHDKEWYDLVKEKLRRNKKVHMHFKPPQASAKPPAAYRSSRYTEHHFKQYVQAINPFGDETFDLVLVDGRARVGSAQAAIPKIKPSGFLMLDNSERADYGPIFKELQGWKRWDFYGIGPFELLMWQTTLWQKPKKKRSKS
jgi:hypothetical protein